MKKIIILSLIAVIALTAGVSSVVAAETKKTDNDSQTKEKLIVMYWDLYARLKAATSELSQYKVHYTTLFNIASREYTNVPSIRVLKVTTSATSTAVGGTSGASTSASCTNCGPFLDITWRASNLPAVRLDLISTSTNSSITLSTSTPNDGKETIRLNIPTNQPAGKYYLVMSAAEQNLSTVGKTQKPVLTLMGGTATIHPYTLKPSFKLITPVPVPDPMDLRADADAKYKAENPSKGGKDKKKSTKKEEEDEGCSIAGAMILGPGCHINNR